MNYIKYRVHLRKFQIFVGASFLINKIIFLFIEITSTPAVVETKSTQLEIVEERNLLGKEFRIYGTKENPLFLAKDVAEWIEHSNVSMMLGKVDDEEKELISIPTLNNAYGRNSNLMSDTWFLTEDGLYEVLMQSRKPIAKAFKKEVKKILKQIRATGGYVKVEIAAILRVILYGKFYTIKE